MDNISYLLIQYLYHTTRAQSFYTIITNTNSIWKSTIKTILNFTTNFINKPHIWVQRNVVAVIQHLFLTRNYAKYIWALINHCARKKNCIISLLIIFISIEVQLPVCDSINFGIKVHTSPGGISMEEWVTAL